MIHPTQESGEFVTLKTQSSRPMTDAEIRKACAEQFFGLDGLGEIIPWQDAGREYEHQTLIRRYHGQDGIVYCPNPKHVGKVYPDPLNNDADACAVLDRMAELNLNFWLQVRIVSRCDVRAWSCIVLHNETGRTTDAFEFLNPKGRRRAIVLAALKAVGVGVEG